MSAHELTGEPRPDPGPSMVNMGGEISGDVPRYKYEQAADVIEARIKAGEWPVRLPGEVELSRDLGIGRNTLRHALRLLADRGVVKILPGVAVYIVRSES